MLFFAPRAVGPSRAARLHRFSAGTSFYVAIRAGLWRFAAHACPGVCAVRSCWRRTRWLRGGGVVGSGQTLAWDEVPKISAPSWRRFRVCPVGQVCYTILVSHFFGLGWKRVRGGAAVSCCRVDPDVFEHGCGNGHGVFCRNIPRTQVTGSAPCAAAQKQKHSDAGGCAAAH